MTGHTYIHHTLLHHQLLVVADISFEEAFDIAIKFRVCRIDINDLVKFRCTPTTTTYPLSRGLLLLGVISVLTSAMVDRQQ